jgi:hypothetical protein
MQVTVVDMVRTVLDKRLWVAGEGEVVGEGREGMPPPEKRPAFYIFWGTHAPHTDQLIARVYA